jgi:hypothetical protein
MIKIDGSIDGDRLMIKNLSDGAWPEGGRTIQSDANTY